MKDTLQFLRELPLYQADQPYELYGFPEKTSETRTNCEFEVKDVDVLDCRLHDVSVSTHGFMFLDHQSACDLDAKNFETVGGDSTTIMAYLEETVGLVRDLFMPVDVICFDWRFRRRDPKVSGRIPPRALKDIRNFALPTGDVVHCDYSYNGGHDRLKMQLLPDEMEEFRSKSRKAMIINVWRPLNNTVKNTPLLLCDRRSVLKEDLIEVDKVLSDKVEKSYFMFHRAYHRWYYLSNQRSNEVVIFPTWTSKSAGDEFSDCCPHGAGASETDGWADPRQSVEVRLLVIFEKDGNIEQMASMFCSPGQPHGP